jgi:CubicO group peptidase (beta-lactamase class C family)
MRRLRISVTAALVLAMVASGARELTHAQSLTTGLFDRYTDALRQEIGIPGLSAAIVQNGSIVLERAFGYADIGAAIRTRTDTPYPVANLSETVGSALLLQQCVDYGTAELSDRVVRWTTFPDQAATLGQVLAHVSAANSYQYDPTRFGTLSSAVAECVKQPYARLVATQILDFLTMRSSVPGRDAVEPPNSALFSASTLENYRSVLARTAVPYRVGSNKVATRSDYTGPSLNAATGLISTVLDLAKFDAALSNGTLISRDLLTLAWQPNTARPTGLGWFVQTYGPNDEKLVWHFGVAKDAYSSLIVKLPGRGLTLILLANSDGLGSGLNTAQPNVTQSPFARIFLQLFAS